MANLPVKSVNVTEMLPTDQMMPIMSQHVDMVYSTARRLVGDSHLAEDVAQAAFIALARKIDRVEDRTIAGWLVNATRLAAKEAMRSQRVRKSNESTAATLRREASRPTDDATSEHLLPLLDEALSKLSEADRAAVAIRFFEGKSFEQVGAALGTTEEAARKRVVRAVDKMRRFFLQQGIKTGVGGLTVILAAQQATKAPAAIAAGTASGGSTTAIQLGKGVLYMMRWTQIKIGLIIAMVLVTVATVGYGLDAFNAHPAMQPSTAQTPTPTTSATPVPARSSDLASLRKQRIDALTRAFTLSKEMYSRGLIDFSLVRNAERELLQARLEAADSTAARAQVLSEMLISAKDQETLVESRFKAGLCSDVDVAESTADRLQVEILIAKDKMP
jgi:RNA polymerase sigma factor (sigma-70 family)